MQVMRVGRGSQRGLPIRFIIAGVIALVSLLGYFAQREYNPVTGETQHVNISPSQEVALGLQAAPELTQQYGGLLPDAAAQARVDRVGNRVVAQSRAHETPYTYEFHLLADPSTINAFALPGGQVFITQALVSRLQTDGELAAVLGHEIGHVVGRHGAEHLAKQQLTQGLAGAAGIAAYDPNNPSSANAGRIAAAVGQLVQMRFGRQDEIESDTFGVRFMADAGYDPRAMLRLMQVLASASEGQARQPEFFSTHPNPENRTERIQAAIQEQFPNGVPAGLEP